MSFSLLEYYKALNGESTESSNVWHINYTKRHAYRISSDFDAIDEHNKKINLPPSEAETDLVNVFSDKLGQKLKNTKITDNGDGTESIDLELDDRIVTIIMDQSGSMTWNDHNNFRHDVATDLVNKIEINYPGDITYNLIEYGADIINVLFFGIIENDSFDPNDIDSLSKMIKADDLANYDGMRIIRNDDHYPTSVLDGEIVDDGFISRIKDSGLVEGHTYYYTIYTYDKDYKFSEGVRVKVTSRARVVPRSISNFRTVVNSEDLTKGVPFTGYGINRDDNTVGIWHMDEGEGKFLYDFSDNDNILEHSKENPIWYESRFVPAGTSGLFFDGVGDYAYLDGVSELELSSQTSTTVCAWIYPYSVDGLYVIASSMQADTISFILYTLNGRLHLIQNYGDVRYNAYSNDALIEVNKWQHVCVTTTGGIFTLYINGIEISYGLTTASPVLIGTTNLRFSIGVYRSDSFPFLYYFRGKITEFSIHNTVRDLAYIQSQVVSNPILNSEGGQVDSEFSGIKEDNGDRLAVFKYNVPKDYNYVGGEISVVRNEKHIPSWEEDGDIIYQVDDPGSGEFFISNVDDFVLGEKYYYRLFTKNSLGNVSFLSDSPSLTVEIPEAATDDYFLDLDTSVLLNPSGDPIGTKGDAIDSPESPDVGQLITSGNGKVYLRWKQNDPIDSRIARVKIFYSSSDFPVVNINGGSSGRLVFTGLTTDEKFVHRNIPNDINAYYTIVNTDKYGRSSNYNEDGVQVEDFLHASVVPTSSANENTFPLIEIENVNYELVDSNTITIGWDQPQKSIEDIEAYFDQTIYVYGAISDEFGDAISEDTPIKMSITAAISRETQADDIFGGGVLTQFEDIEAYDFFVTKTNDGFFKGVLRMTSNVSIMAQIREATFQIQLKALIPREGGYTPPNDNTISGDPISEYASLIEQLAGEEESTSTSSDNFYEYYSKTIQVHYTNPWEVELVGRDNQKVYQRCYCVKTDEKTSEKVLNVESASFHGIYMKATNPFVARAKVKYKGQPLESGNIQLAVWDADSTELCKNSCSGSSSSPSSSYEGPKLQPSITVPPPDSILSIIQGQEETYDGSGVYTDISYVDIPLYAPEAFQAVRLFVKGEKAGYSSVKDIYILFQSILLIDIDTNSEGLTVDGKDIAEFRSNAFIINPDYPNYYIPDSLDASLVTYPEDLTVVQWDVEFIQAIDGAAGSGPRSIYSTDSVPLTNGVYSYTRSGTARNVFLGPVPKGDEKINEDHEIKASIVYQGLSSFAKTFFSVGPYDPEEFDRTSARFLMEIDGGWEGDLPNQLYGGGGWSTAENWPLWTDGIHYKKIKISRNPRIAESGTAAGEFAYANCFRDCASDDDNELLELSSGQIVEVSLGGVTGPVSSAIVDSTNLLNSEVEILHGEIYEVEDAYTGLHYLEVGDEGFIDNGTAFIELNAEDVSDVTYFYIRINKTISDSGKISDEFCDEPEPVVINDCLCLNGSDGITECDVPAWEPTSYVNGKTTVFLNNNPLVLNGGGNMYNGIPPCPICMNEPLLMETVWRKVTDYFYDTDLGNPSNDFLYPVDTFTDSNNFTDDNGETLVKHTSDVTIRVKVLWRGQNVPDGTPVYVSVGDNTASSLFVASQNVYYTQTISTDYSYVDVLINARRYIDSTRTEQIEIFSTYDESDKTVRHIGQNYSLTLDKKNKEIEEPPVLPVDPSTGIAIDPVPITPYSPTMDRYSITDNGWDRVSNMSEARGNGFSGSVGNFIYYIGGLLGNSLNISDKNEQYDILNDEWNDVTKMTIPRFGGMSVTIGDDIYTIGGIFSNDKTGGNLGVSILVEVYHADVDMWEELEHMPIIAEGSAFEKELGVAFGSASHVMMGKKNYIYIVGGVKDAIVTADQFTIREHNQRILRYCVEDDEWEYSNILRSNELNTYERISPLSIVFDNKLIVFNGAILEGNNFTYPSEEFYIDLSGSFVTPSSGEWLTLGSNWLRSASVPKAQSAMTEYNLNPSADHADYYIFGGFNNNSPSLDITEKITAQDSGFEYYSSYNMPNPSVDLEKMLIGKHGASAEFSDVDGSPFIYLMGGYTVNRDDDYVDISFDL
jgi:hypothetical protein